jgi:hypothetical protein
VTAGIGGVFTAKLLGHVRRKMLSVGLPAVLNDIGNDGAFGPPARIPSALTWAKTA